MKFLELDYKYNKLSNVVSFRADIVVRSAIFCTFFLTSASRAEGIDGPPHFNVSSVHGVNLISGNLNETVDDLRIGSGPLALTHSIMSFNGQFIHFQDNFSGNYLNPGEYLKDHSISFNGMSDLFSDTQAWPKKSINLTGGALTSPSALQKVYISGDGTEVHYDSNIFNGIGSMPIAALRSASNMATATKAIYPSGFEITLFFTERDHPVLTGRKAHRIQSVVSSSGYQLKYSYMTDDRNGDFVSWNRPYKITAINQSVEYCDPSAFSCQLSEAWPSVSYEWPVIVSGYGLSDTERDFKITFSDNTKATYKHSLYCATGPGTSECSPRINNNAKISSIVHSSSNGAATKSFEYGNKYHCSAYVGMQVNCNYSERSIVTKSKVGSDEIGYSSSFPQYEYVPLGITAKGDTTLSVSVSLLNPNRINPTFVFDERRALKFGLTANGSKVKTATYDLREQSGGPLRQSVFEYDSNGNLIKRLDKAEDGTLPEIVSSAGYDNHCGNNKTLNKPSWSRDAQGNQTDYSYHCASGQIAIVTSPADRNGVRQQTRYSYTQKYAWVKNASGSYVKAATPIWLLTREAYCKTSSATTNGCSVSNDEVVTTYDYGPDAGPNNLLLRGKTVIADGASSTTCYTYDKVGNQISETRPRANVTSCY